MDNSNRSMRFRVFVISLVLAVVILINQSVGLASGRPRPRPGGGQDPYCALLNAFDSPGHTPACRPTQCEQCPANGWLVACQTFEYVVSGGLNYYFGEYVGTMAELGFIWVNILNVFSETATDYFCGPQSPGGFTGWMENICAAFPNSQDCQAARLVYTCSCMGHAGARGTYRSQMQLYCDKCACYRARNYSSADDRLQAAKNCLNRGRPRPGGGRAYGDPNLISLDGQYITDQRAGEFIAVKKLAGQPGPDLEVQFRYEPWGAGSSVSMVTALAIKLNGTRLGIYARPSPEVRINGTLTSVPGAGLLLPGGLEIFRDTATYYTIYAPNGDIFTVNLLGDFMNVSVELTDDLRNRVLGVLGNFTGDPSGDPTSWPSSAYRITTAADSLFDYRAGESLATFNNPSFPSLPFDPDGAPPAARQTAEQACTQAGVTDPAIRQGCIRDQLATGGESQFLTAASEISAELTTMTVSKVAPEAGQTKADDDGTLR